ncbi:MAG TPA: glycosyltransferase family 2 protein [Nitrososphaerales archaeon]|nr:glycosyltransferase family 2 protein [Nitrososphaerales archaeon]
MALTYYEIGWYVVLILWLAYLPYGLAFLVNYVKNRHIFLYKPNGVFPRIGATIVFQITTLSVTDNLDIVERGIASIKRSARELHLSSFKVVTVSDDPRDASTNVDADEAIVVPSSYRCNAVKKARSLNYAALRYKERIRGLEDTWIFHIDEESVVLPQTIEAIVKYIASEDGVLAEGPILFPSTLSRNALSGVADSIRSSSCYFCVSTISGKSPPSHLHGSNLLIRADVECEIGWENDKSIAEDQLFGYYAHDKYPRFGWHGGIILESSPSSISGLMRQRKRWVVGTLQNWKHMNARLKRETGFRLAIWTTGFFATMVSIPLWILTVFYFVAGTLHLQVGTVPYLQPPFLTTGQVASSVLSGGMGAFHVSGNLLEVVLGVGAAASLAIWAFSYVLGFYLNHLYNTRAGLVRHTRDVLTLLLSLWFVGFLENEPMVAGLIEFLQGKASWEVTPK